MKAAAILLLLLPPSVAQAQTDAQLRYICKGFIERALHDPGRSKLEWTEGRTARNKQGQHIVQIRGRAPNAMGALVLATFECTLTYSPPDNFRLINLRTF